ncbi:MAG: FAD-binding oxidoreductase [Capsulimonadaceae bacterium]
MSETRYALNGLEPLRTAIPESVDEVRDIVRGSAGLSVIPWGGGTRQHIGYAPPRYDLAVDTRGLSRIVEYVPDDMVVTVQAGASLAAVQAVLAEHRQQLPIDIAEPDCQTIGGVVASRPDSLRRFGFGSIRDSLIGVAVVNAAGDLIRGGGRVVKNVSGYDLPKLYCGSFGTLGLIVEGSFKVAPIPEASATALLVLRGETAADDILGVILGGDLSPSFLYLLNHAAAEELLDAVEDNSGAQYLVVGFDGAHSAVDWQVGALEALVGPRGEAPGPLKMPATGQGRVVRDRLRDDAHRPATASASFHILSSQVGAFSRLVEWTARRVGFSARVVADAAVGIVRARFEPRGETGHWPDLQGDLFEKAQRYDAWVTIERMPQEWRSRDVPVWNPIPPDFALMRRIKDALDPGGMWNPGRFVGRI